MLRKKLILTGLAHSANVKLLERKFVLERIKIDLFGAHYALFGFNRFLAVDSKHGRQSLLKFGSFFAWDGFPIFVNHIYNISNSRVFVKPFFMFLLAVKHFVSHFHRARLGEQNGFSYLNFHNTYILH